MFPILKTDRLILRELTEEDAPRILQCFSNTNVLRYYGQKPLQDVDQVKQIIHNFKLSYNARNGIKWGIELKDKKELIGTIGFHDWSSEHKRANISYAFYLNTGEKDMRLKLFLRLYHTVSIRFI